MKTESSWEIRKTDDPVNPWHVFEDGKGRHQDADAGACGKKP